MGMGALEVLEVKQGEVMVVETMEEEDMVAMGVEATLEVLMEGVEEEEAMVGVMEGDHMEGRGATITKEARVKLVLFKVVETTRRAER